jgi:circadian clock protein KaiB
MARRSRAARKPQESSSSRWEQLLAGQVASKYVLRLYVAGSNLHSMRAIENTRRLCNGRLRGKCELRVIDLYQQPMLARRDHIVTVPALVKVSPGPVARFIGDMSNSDKILQGLGVMAQDIRTKSSGAAGKRKKDEGR